MHGARILLISVMEVAGEGGGGGGGKVKRIKRRVVVKRHHIIHSIDSVKILSPEFEKFYFCSYVYNELNNVGGVWSLKSSDKDPDKAFVGKFLSFVPIFIHRLEWWRERSMSRRRKGLFQ